MRHHGWRWLGALLLVVTGCDGSTGLPEREPASITISPARDTLEAIQDTLFLAAEVRDALGGTMPDARIVWTSLDPGIATVDSTGRVVSRGAGDARISASSGRVADTARVAVHASVSEDRLHFVRLSESAPSLATRDTSFWAVRGDGREIELHYLSGEPGEEGEEFLEFRVPGNALLRYPDGRLFEEGDSVQIHIRVDETNRFLFQFEPSGLQFDPDHPAEMRVFYRHASDEDVQAEDAFSLWKQERPDSPWLRIASLRIKDVDEVRAEITGFTGFALATD